jgi:trehalose synthase
VRPVSVACPAVLQEVNLGARSLADYTHIVGRPLVEEIHALAESLEGKRVLHMSATAFGGGVSEILYTLVPLMRDVGIDAHWQVILGREEFFNVTKLMHNSLQGDPARLDDDQKETYDRYNHLNAMGMEGGWDVIVVHDPQPALMRSYAPENSTKWVWRCHIDLTDAQPDMWEFFRPFVQEYDASVWTMAEFVPASLDMDRIVHAPPCIDPLSVKNLDLAMPFCTEITRQYGVDPHRPIVCQVSRFDPWKDPIGVIEAYRIVREQVPDAQLLLAGSMATDDPEGFRVWEETEELRAGDREIHLLSNLHQVGAVQINAFQRIADVVVQKSLREGFGLTVSEALWKGRPVVGGRAGGIKLQIREGFDGYLVDDVESCARRIIDLLDDPVGADAMGAQGREHVRQNFLSTRELEDWLRLLGELRD